MEKVGGSGDGTFNHLSQASNNITVPLDTITKDKEIHSCEGTMALDWKLSLPSLQTSNDQILAHCQHDNDSCLRKSTVSIHRPSGQSRNHGCTVVLLRENYPQHESKHVCSNDGPSETSATGEKLLLHQYPIQLSSSSCERQHTSTSTTTNVPQQSMPHMIVLNSNNLRGSWKNNLYKEQQNVKITHHLPKDSTCQGLFTDVGHFGVVLAQAQTVKLYQRNACIPKDTGQQKYAPQKAIAVVTPLTQQAVADVTFSKNLTNMKEGGLETRFAPNKNDHQTCIPHTLQSTPNESGVKILYDYMSQPKEEQSKSVLAPGVSHYEKDDGPAENNQLPGQSERLSSVPLSGSIETKEVQLCPTDDNSSSKCLSKDNATVKGRNSEESRMDKLSTIPVNEWSLQRLHTLVIGLEQMQKKQQRNIPFNNLSSEILKLYWNGDYQKLCSAAKSNLYINIMKEARLHCGKENSVILQGVSRERLNEIASSFHILEHGVAPPKMVYRSSWLNLSDPHYDIDKQHECLSSLMTLRGKSQIAHKELPMKKMENMQKSTNEKLKTSNKALSGEVKPAEHQKNSSVEGDKVIRKEPVVMDVENTSSVKETGQDAMTVENVVMKRAQSEKQNKTKGENEVPLPESLNRQSSGVSDGSIKPGNLFKLPTTDTTPVLDRNGFANCVSVEMSILPPEKARSSFTGEPDKVVDNIQKDAQILTERKDEGTVELFDQDKKLMDTEMKSDERSNGIKIIWHLEKYCCLAKWLQVLGFRNGGRCKCEQKAELGHHADTLGKGVKEANAVKHMHPFNKACKLTDTDIGVLRDNRQAKCRLEYRSIPGKKSVTSHANDDASMDEIEIVDVITNYEDVLKMSNAMSEQLTAVPLLACTSHDSTSGRKHYRNHKGITMPRFKTRDTLIHLALFGTSHLRQKKNISAFASLDNVDCPPETLDVKISSGWNEYPNTTKSQTPKQKVWNSWKKTHVPSKTSTNRRSKKLKHAKEPESKNDTANNSLINTAVLDQIPTLSHEDVQTCQSEAKCENTFSLASADKQKNIAQARKKNRKNISSTRKDKIRKLKQNKILTSLNLNKRRNCTNNGHKLVKSSFEPAQAIDKSKKLNTGLALNFGVLPESFNISDGSSSMEASQSAGADSGTKVKTVMQTKRTWSMSDTWCDSPRKKRCLKSTITLPNTSGSSTFQEFKKKYEEKKRRIHT